MSRSGGSTILYHEVQESKLCGVHCVNTVLQGPFFSELDLAAVAAELDKSEMQMGISGALDHRHHYAQLPSFSAPSSSSASPSFSCGLGDEVSSNVSADGNFSIQVLAKALDVWDLKLTSLDSRDAQAAKENPQQEVAFICHLHDHWFTIRKVGYQWYNFNSLYPAPEHLSNFYLSAFLGSLQSEGWSIFVVRGNFPTECVFSSESGNSFGQWLTPEDAERISKSTKTSNKVAEEEDPTLKAAIKASLEDSTSNIRFGNQSISSLAASMAASLADVKVPEDKWRKAS